MYRNIRATLLASVVLVFALSSVAVAQDRPLTGKKVPAFAPVDTAMLEFMDKIDCQAATIAISLNGQILYSRGYGWIDSAKKKPIPADALLRIASVSKPITAAAIKTLIRGKKLTPETKAFELIAVKAPGGKIADPRISDITIGQLLDHKGGWDRDTSYDPMFRMTEVAKTLKLTGPATPMNVIEYMMTQPLQFEPGSKSVYSNFGYCVLGRVLEKQTKKPYIEGLQQLVLNPLKIKDIKLGNGNLTKLDPREVWYPIQQGAFSLDVMDAHGGLIASTPALCQFMQAYWISGEPRLAGQKANYTFFGSLPGTTAMARQRNDGINIAVLLNKRRDKNFGQDNDALKQSIDQVVDKIIQGK